MLTKSYLLVFLISYAEKFKTAYKKQRLSANLFFMALLKTIELYKSNGLHSKFAADGKTELEKVIAYINEYDFDVARALNALVFGVSASSYEPLRDELDYERIIRTVEDSANQNGSKVLTVLDYTKAIMAAPSPLIYRHIVSRGKKVKATETKPSGSGNVKSAYQTTRPFGFNDVKSSPQTTRPFGFNDVKSSPQTTNQPHAAADSYSPAGELEDIVETTRNLQNVLLENVFGQEQAVNTFVSGYFQSRLMACSRSETKKPQATFLFAGPPGVGKTFLAEKVAEAVKLPYRRFDMSEYSDKEANFEFCGSSKVYKNGAPGNVTSFVSENPKSVLLFDEIEKAHINIIHLFLQILDAGRLRDSYTDEEVSFKDAIIIFTTNVGKNLYNDPTVANLSSLPRKKILKALSTDIDPATQAPLFPAAICSRFASGNLVMFNHLEASNLLTIAHRELDKNVRGFEKSTGIKINIDDSVAGAILFSEGGKADARMVSGRANSFFHEELYELLRLVSARQGVSVRQIKEINVTVPVEELDGEIADMFENPNYPRVLVFANGGAAKRSFELLQKYAVVHIADNIESAKQILFENDVDIVICDVICKVRSNQQSVLNADDISSVGKDFLGYALEKYALPVYILQVDEDDITREEFLSFAKQGVKGVVTLNDNKIDFANSVLEKCRMAYQQAHMLKLAKANKALSYKTSQSISSDKRTAEIRLFDFKFNLITDIDDSKNVLDNVSRPDMTFDEVIGAADAKEELKFFVQYLKNPTEYMRKGIRSPKGVLLYGPPGTGKTLLAKAMAGESGVTFLKAEGNEFLKRFVGEGPQAVHALFNAARKYAPSIVFIDEIDAIGKDRGSMAPSDTSGDVLTSFLTEMDGFNTDTSKPVFVLAATNYGIDPKSGKSLDPALLRRFDRRIYVDLPNKAERRQYLEMKTQNNPTVRLSEDQLDNIALRSTGMSLAELESVIEMALRNAIRTEKGEVGDAEFDEAFETFNGGEQKSWNTETLMRTARHEAGHALISWLNGNDPTYLTIVARGSYGGYMQQGDVEDKGIYTKTELLGNIRTALGGRAAELEYYGDAEGVSTGASSDLYSATQIAEQMVCVYGMDDTVGVSFVDMKSAGDGYQQLIRDRVNAILKEEMDNARADIARNKKAIDAMVRELMVKNHLKEKEIGTIFDKMVVFDKK